MGDHHPGRPGRRGSGSRCSGRAGRSADARGHAATALVGLGLQVDTPSAAGTRGSPRSTPGSADEHVEPLVDADERRQQQEPGRDERREGRQRAASSSRRARTAPARAASRDLSAGSQSRSPPSHRGCLRGDAVERLDHLGAPITPASAAMAGRRAAPRASGSSESRSERLGRVSSTLTLAKRYCASCARLELRRHHAAGAHQGAQVDHRPRADIRRTSDVGEELDRCPCEPFNFTTV